MFKSAFIEGRKEKVWFDIIKRALKDYDVGVYTDNIFFCKFEKEITNV